MLISTFWLLPPSANAATGVPVEQVIATLRSALADAPSNFSHIRGEAKEADRYGPLWEVTNKFQSLCPACNELIKQWRHVNPLGNASPCYEFSIAGLYTDLDSAGALQYIKKNLLSWIPATFTRDDNPDDLWWGGMGMVLRSGSIGPMGNIEYRFNGPEELWIDIQFNPAGTFVESKRSEFMISIYHDYATHGAQQRQSTSINSSSRERPSAEPVKRRATRRRTV